MENSFDKNFTLDSKAKKFLARFPNTVYAYIGDSNKDLPIIHSEILDLERQREGYGIYFSVNGFHSGKRVSENLTNINAFFVDIDYPDKLNRTKEAVHAYKQDLLMELCDEGLIPTFIVETKNGLHVYWMIHEPVTLANFGVPEQEKIRIWYRDIEEAMLKRFDGDPGAKDVARVLRVPGTIHQKDPHDPFTCKLVHFAEDNVYKFSEIRDTFLKKLAPDGWATANGENPINDEVKDAIQKEYPKLDRPSYKKLFSLAPGSVPEGMRNKSLLVAAHAAKEAGWAFEKTCAHFQEFHGLKLREIRRTIRSAYDNSYDFGYNNEVMQLVVEPEERTMLSKITSKVLSKSTKEKRDVSNSAQQEKYKTYEFILAERVPNLKFKNRGEFYDYKDGVYSPLQADEVRSILFREMLADGLYNYRTQSKINDKIAAFKSIPGKVFSHEEENPDTKIINFRNGLLNIDTYELHPHSPGYLSTSQIPIVYNREARSPLWFNFLNEITNGDREQQKLLQQIAGYCLTNDTRYAKAFIFFGSGANGKSLFTRIVSKLVGRDNVSSLNLGTITKQFGLTGLIGKKLNIVDEISGNYFESNVIKNIVSGEKMAADVKFRPDPIEFVPVVKLIFSVNELPKINDTTPGLYRRFIIVPFERTFVSNPDLDLEQKLSTELDGILNWAVEGLKSLRANGRFAETDKNRGAMHAFKIENSPFLEFLTSEYEPAPSHEEHFHGVTVGDFYSEYKQYCFTAGYRHKSMATFSRELSHTVLSGWNLIRKKEGNTAMVFGIRKVRRNITSEPIVYPPQQHA